MSSGGVSLSRRRVVRTCCRGRSAERGAHERVLEALGLVRERGYSLSKAAKVAGTTPGTVLHHVGRQGVRKTPSGRFSDASIELSEPCVGIGAREVGVQKISCLLLVPRHQMPVAVVGDRDRRVSKVGGERLGIDSRGDHE